MSPVHAGVVVVGAGHSGGRLAQRLRSRGYQGRLTVIGEEMDPPYERPPLSKSVLAGRVPAEKTHLCERSWYSSNGVTLRVGSRVVGIEREQKRIALADGETIPYEKLVLAPGARPRRLGAADCDIAGVFTLRTLSDAERLREYLSPGKVVAIIGAGLIGLELASTALERGCAPFVLEAFDRPLARVVPAEVAALFSGLLETRGIRCHYNARIAAIKTGASGLAVELADGRCFPCGVLVVAIGVEPNTELAANAGIEVANGVVTDMTAQTSDPDVFAVGDAAYVRPAPDRDGARLETWHNAEVQADRLAAFIAEDPSVPAPQAPWFWTDQFGLNVQFAGNTAGVDEIVWCGPREPVRTAAIYLTRGEVVGGMTIAHPMAMRCLRRWLIPGRPRVSRAEAADLLSRLAA